MYFRIERGTTLDSLTIWSIDVIAEFTTTTGTYCRGYYDSVYWTADGKLETRHKDSEQLYVFLKSSLAENEDELRNQFAQLKSELVAEAEARIAVGAAALQSVGHAFRDLHQLQQLILVD